MPEHKQGAFRFEPDKVTATNWHTAPSAVVRPPRLTECPLQLEAVVSAAHRPIGPDRGTFLIFETRVVAVHASRDIVIPDTDHVDPKRWTPLLYVFRHYFGTGPELGRTFRATA